MTRQNNNLSKRIYIRLKQQDYDKLMGRFSKTTCRKLSEFARLVLLEKPVTIKQRNQSLDDFMTEMIRLRNELAAIGNNINQSVKILYTLNQISEFKSWLRLNEAHQKSLDEKVTEIKTKINQISEQWLR